MQQVPRSIDALIEQLRALRLHAGSPSYREIARLVSEVRARRGVPEHAHVPSHMTIHNCFREGRKRVSTPLILEIVEALGANAAEVARWRSWCAAAQASKGPLVLPTHLGLPAKAEPFVAPHPSPSRLSAQGLPVRIAGMAGAGKTQIAAAIAQELIDQGTVRGFVTVEVRASDPMRTPPDFRDVIDAAARCIGARVGDGSDIDGADALMSELRQRRLGLLLDDVSDAHQVAALCRRADGVPLIMTTRRTFPFEAPIHHVECPPWDEEDILSLLRLVVGSERMDSDPSGAETFAALASGLPLMAGILAEQARSRPDWSFDDLHASISATAHVREFDNALDAAFSGSYDALSAEDRRALRLLATQPCTSLRIGAVSQLLGRSRSAADAAIRSLQRTHLVEPGERARMHALVRAFATRRSWQEDPQRARDEALDRLADGLVSGTWAAAEAAHPGTVALSRRPDRIVTPIAESEALAWFADELPNLVDMATASWPRQPDRIIDLSEAVDRYLDTRSMFGLSEALHRQAVRAADLIGDDLTTATATVLLGRTLVRRGRAEAGDVLNRASRAADDADAPRMSMRAASALAILAANTGRADAALNGFRRALDIAHSSGYEEMTASLMDNVAILLRRAGDLDGARAHHERAATIAEERGDAVMLGTALSNLSGTLLTAGETDAAVETAERVLAMDVLRDTVWHTNATNNLAGALSARGDHEEAVRRYHDALDLVKQSDTPSIVAAIRYCLGDAYLQMSRGKESRANFEVALRVATEADSAYERARSLAGLAEWDVRAGRRDAAAQRLREAEELFGDSDSPEARRVRKLLAQILPA